MEIRKCKEATWKKKKKKEKREQMLGSKKEGLKRTSVLF